MDQVVEVAAKLFRSVHQGLREQIEGLDREALHWKPGPETNSIAVMVIHLLGSEAEVLRVVRGESSNRHRPSEFVEGTETADDLLKRLDAADRLLDEQTQAMPQDRLSGIVTLPNRPAQTGLQWLLSNAGHAREHLGQVELTKQLYMQRSGEQGNVG